MKNKWWIGPAIGTILLLVFLLLPPIEPLTPLGMKTIGIFLFTAVWWATVGIGYPSVLCIAYRADRGHDTSRGLCCFLWLVDNPVFPGKLRSYHGTQDNGIRPPLCPLVYQSSLCCRTSLAAGRDVFTFLYDFRLNHDRRGDGYHLHGYCRAHASGPRI